MTQKLIELAERRARLVAQAEAQRTTLAQSAQPWRLPLAVVDQGWAAMCQIKRHPALVAGAAVLLVVWRPRSIGKWLRRGWVGWQVARKVRGFKV
jgi:hypothetical protein